MLKRLLNLFKRPLKAVIVRRYTITSGTVGEMYINGTCVADTLDTYPLHATEITTTAHYNDFIRLYSDNMLIINNVELDRTRIQADVKANWALDA